MGLCESRIIVELVVQPKNCINKLAAHYATKKIIMLMNWRRTSRQKKVVLNIIIK